MFDPLGLCGQFNAFVLLCSKFKYSFRNSRALVQLRKVDQVHVNG